MKASCESQGLIGLNNGKVFCKLGSVQSTASRHAFSLLWNHLVATADYGLKSLHTMGMYPSRIELGYQTIHMFLNGLRRALEV